MKKKGRRIGRSGKLHPIVSNFFRPLFRSSLADHLLASERAALGKTGLTTGGLAENGRAAGANDDGLGV